jgi:hypothetical protein
MNQGNYNFSFPSSFNVGQSPVDIAAGDLDGDAKPDLVAVNRGSGNITILFSGGGQSDPPPPPTITLTLSTSRTWSARLVTLRWTGAPGSVIDIYRNGSRIAVVSNSGSYTDRFSTRTSGTFTYKVCAGGTQICSRESSIKF